LSGWPIVGDPVYGEPRWQSVVDPGLADALRTFARQALHAWRVAFVHPVSGARLQIRAPLPDDMSALLSAAALELTEGTEETESSSPQRKQR
jgi:23S rRNA pseudouridine1911/1915/1917 synthase